MESHLLDTNQPPSTLFSLNTLIGSLIAIGSAALSSFSVNLQARSLALERIESNLSERDPELLFDFQNYNTSYENTRVAATSLSENTRVATSTTQSQSGQSTTATPTGQNTAIVDLNDELDLLLQPDELDLHNEQPPPAFLDTILLYFYHDKVTEARDAAISMGFPATSTAWRDRVMARIWLRAQWYLGFVLYLLCQLFGSVVALSYITPLLLAPLGSTGLVFNIIFARMFLGTGITKYDWIGTMMIVVGCTIVSLFGNKIPDADSKLEEIIRLFTKPTFIAYISILLLACILTFLLIQTVEFNLLSLRTSLAPPNQPNQPSSSASSTRPTPLSPGPPPLETATSSTPPSQDPVPPRRQVILVETTSDLIIQSSGRFSLYGDIGRARPHTPPPPLSTLQQHQQHQDGDASNGVLETDPLLPSSSLPSSPLSPLQHPSQTNPTTIKKGLLTSLLGILYSILGGSAASLTLLFTKSGVSIVLSSLLSGKGHPDHQPLDTPSLLFLGVLLLLLLLSIVVQIYSLNVALKYQVPLLVLPLFFSFYTCLALLNTMVYVDAFGSGNTAPLDIVVLFGGVAVLVAGVTLLGRK